MPTWMSMNFQDCNSPLMEHLMMFHDHSMILITIITILTLQMITSALLNNKFDYSSSENQKIEIFWTLTPSVSLIFIALPSMKLLFLTEEFSIPSWSMKINGFQWYWSYETEEEMIQTMETSKSLRLLTPSTNLLIPTKLPLRLISTSLDVIHSWTIPSLGIKADAIPGRLNQMSTIINHPAILTGQCSEICGTNHSFMPIQIKAF